MLAWDDGFGPRRWTKLEAASTPTDDACMDQGKPMRSGEDDSPGPSQQGHALQEGLCDEAVFMHTTDQAEREELQAIEGPRTGFEGRAHFDGMTVFLTETPGTLDAARIIADARRSIHMQPGKNECYRIQLMCDVTRESPRSMAVPGP